MISLVYRRGLLEWPDLNNTDFVWLLLDSTYDPSATDDFISAVAAAELTDASYARVTLTGSSISQTTDALGPAIVYDATAPTFPTLGGSTDAAWIVLAREVTNDADSPLMGCWAIDYNPTGVDFTPLIHPIYGLHVHSVVTEAYWPAG